MSAQTKAKVADSSQCCAWPAPVVRKFKVAHVFFRGAPLADGFAVLHNGPGLNSKSFWRPGLH